MRWLLFLLWVTDVAAVQVQKKSYASSAAATSHTITPDSTPTSGNLLILVVCSDATVNTPSGWTSAVSAVDFVGLYIYYKTSDGTETSIAVSPTSSAQQTQTFYEYSGMASSSQLDKTASSSNTSVSSVPSGTTATTAQADEVLIAAIGISSANSNFQTISSYNNSFVEEHQVAATGSGTLTRLGVASRTVSATGAYSTTATLSGQESHPGGCIATFKIAAASAFSFLIAPRLISRLITGGF